MAVKARVAAQSLQESKIPLQEALWQHSCTFAFAFPHLLPCCQATMEELGRIHKEVEALRTRPCPKLPSHMFFSSFH